MHALKEFDAKIDMYGRYTYAVESFTFHRFWYLCLFYSSKWNQIAFCFLFSYFSFLAKTAAIKFSSSYLYDFLFQSYILCHCLLKCNAIIFSLRFCGDAWLRCFSDVGLGIIRKVRSWVYVEIAECIRHSTIPSNATICQSRQKVLELPWLSVHCWSVCHQDVLNPSFLSYYIHLKLSFGLEKYLFCHENTSVNISTMSCK